MHTNNKEVCTSQVNQFETRARASAGAGAGDRAGARAGSLIFPFPFSVATLALVFFLSAAAPMLSAVRTVLDATFWRSAVVGITLVAARVDSRFEKLY